MQHSRTRRAFGTAILAVSALAMTACLGDSDPVEFEITDGDLIGVGVRMTQQTYTIASLAEDDSDNADVQALGDSIAAHHQTQFEAFGDLGITTRETNISAGLTAQTNEIVNDLRLVTGTDFDEQFIARLIEIHEQNIEIINETLLPEVGDAGLEAELLALRAILTADLVELQNLEDELAEQAV